MKKMLILTLALSVMFTVAGFAQDMSQDSWHGQSRACRPAEEPQGNREG